MSSLSLWVSLCLSLSLWISLSLSLSLPSYFSFCYDLCGGQSNKNSNLSLSNLSKSLCLCFLLNPLSLPSSYPPSSPPPNTVYNSPFPALLHHCSLYHHPSFISSKTHSTHEWQKAYSCDSGTVEEALDRWSLGWHNAGPLKRVQTQAPQVAQHLIFITTAKYECRWKKIINCLHFGYMSQEEAGTACWLERQTHDQKIVSSNPSRSGGRIFFSRVNFVCRHLFNVHPTHVLMQ